MHPLIRTINLPLGYRCTFKFDGTGISVDWNGRYPMIRSNRQERKFNKAYAVARNSFMEDVAALIGEPVGVIGMQPDNSIAMAVMDVPTRH